MSIRLSRRLAASLLLLAVLGAPAHGEPLKVGSIFGVLVDSESGETLIGANVLVQGTLIGASTDIDGRYEIPHLEPGTYTLTVSYIGYTATTVSGIVVEAGQSTRVDVSLSPEAIGLDEVVVEARAMLNSEAALLRVRQKSVAVSDAISAEAMGRSGSSDAAAAMSKVTGASVVGGKYVYIRGLGDRYALTQLNGTSLPSADPDRRAFQLDLFPSSLLENIVTIKTFTPDKPGSFSGGLVDVATRDFPERLTFQLSASGSYNTQATFSDVLTYPGGGSDWLGVDDGSRRIPDFLATQKPIPSEIEALRDAEAAAVLDQASRSFSGVMSPTTREAPLGRSFSVAVGNQVRLLGRPLGFTASVTYGRESSGYSDGTIGRWELVGGQLIGIDELTPLRFFGNAPAGTAATSTGYDRSGTDEVNWGAVGTLAFKPHPGHSVSTSIIRTQSGISQARTLAGYWVDLSGLSTFQTRVLGYRERALTSVQGKGEHLLAGATVNWRAAYARNTQDEPDLRYFSNHFTVRESETGTDTLYQSPASLYPAPTRFFRDLTEDSRDFGLDLTVPFRSWSGLPARVKAGAAFTDVGRAFRERRFEYAEGRGFDFGDFGGDVDAYFSAVGIIDTTSTGRFVFGNVIRDASSLRSNYDGSQTVTAAYAMVDIPALRRLRVIGGARLEMTRMETVSGDTTLPRGLLENDDLLPSLNLVYQLSDRMNVRAAYTRTLARPTFRELAPYATFDFVGDLVFRGNSSLRRTLITNYDLRWEWFSRPGELLAASVFYKEFLDPIERVIQTSVGNNSLSVQNVERGDVYGLELEARGRLDRVHRSLGGFQVGGNFTLVRSEVRIPDEEMTVIRAADPDARDTRTLDGQSPYLANVDVTYESASGGTVVSLLYNVFGDRLIAVTEGAAPDVFERPRTSLDVVAAREIRSGLRLKLSVKNLLDSEYRTSQQFKGREYVYALYRTGRTVSLGVSYSI